MVAEERPLRVGLVGCGRIGAGTGGAVDAGNAACHADAVGTSGGLRLVALCDTSAERLASASARHGVAATFDDARRMAREVELDLVVVTVGAEHQPEVVEALLGSGARLLLVEKPVAVSFQRARALAADVAARGGAAVAVNYWRNWHPVWRRLASDVRRRRWGNVRTVLLQFSGGLGNNGAHLLCWLMALGFRFEPERAVSPAVRGPDRVITLPATLETAPVAVVMTDVGPIGHAFVDIELLCDEARLRFTDAGRSLEVSEAASDPDFEGYRTLRPGAVERVTAPDFGRVYSQLAAVARGIEREPVVTLTDGCEVIGLVERIETRLRNDDD